MKVLTHLLRSLFIVSVPFCAFAQDSRIEVDPGDKPLLVRGWLGDDSSFVGNVRVTLHGAAAAKMSVLASDLRRTRGTEIIGRQQIAAGPVIELLPELPTTIPVKVSGIREYGEYKGKIELLLAGQGRERAETIDFTVIAEVRPALTLLAESDRVRANVVNCSWSCWLAEILLPASSFQNLYELRFEKPVAAPVTVNDRTFAVRGERNQFQLTDNQLSLPLPTFSPTPPPGPNPPNDQTQSANEKRFITVPVTLNYSTLPADHYSGAIYLSVAGQTAAVKIPVDINVRIGPLWPLVFLIGGILLGRLFRYMQEKGAPQANALVSLNRLRFRLQSAHADDRAIIEPMLDQANTLINENRLDEAKPLIQSIEARLTTLNELRTIENRLIDKQQDPTVADVLKNIRAARQLISNDQDAEVKTRMDAIKNGLVLLSTTLMGADNQPQPDILEAAERAKTAESAVNTAASIVGPAAPPGLWDRFQKRLAWLTGVSDELRAQATLWILRPLLWLILILFLTALGMKSLYVDNPIFGASSFDYLGLVFWGLSSDVASRTLGNLKLS